MTNAIAQSAQDAALEQRMKHGLVSSTVRHAAAIGVEVALTTVALPLIVVGTTGKAIGAFGYGAVNVISGVMDSRPFKYMEEKGGAFLETPAGKAVKIAALPITIPLKVLDKALGTVFDVVGKVGGPLLDLVTGEKEDADLPLTPEQEKFNENHHRIWLGANLFNDTSSTIVLGLVASGQLDPMIGIPYAVATSLFEWSIMVPDVWKRMGTTISDLGTDIAVGGSNFVRRVLDIPEIEDPYYRKAEKIAQSLVKSHSPALAV